MSTFPSKIGRYSYEVEPFQEDYTGHLSWGFLGNHLLKCASFHANEHGFGMVRLNESDHAWVLSRMVIEMNRIPRTGERYTIETWISSVYRLFTDRCFSFVGEGGEILGYAYTIWAMINMDTRQPVDITQLADTGFQGLIDTEKSCPVRKPSRIRVKNTEPVRTVQTYYSDIDINNHVNSIRYIEHVLDLFPKERYEKQRISRLEVAYNVESYCGEPLSFYLQEVKENVYAVEVHKNVSTSGQGEIVCRCEVTFAE